MSHSFLDPDINIDVKTFCELNANYVAEVWKELGGESIDKKALSKHLLKFFNKPFDDLLEKLMNLQTKEPGQSRFKKND